MIIQDNSGGGKEFVPHPETDNLVKAVIVDVTPAKDRETMHGTKNQFKIVYETETLMEDQEGVGQGEPPKRHCVWSKYYTTSLNEKSNLTKDVGSIRGRAISDEERKSGFDTEDLMGLGVKMMIVHQKSQDGAQTFANIGILKPDPDPIEPSGHYIRVKDRPEKGDYQGG